MIWFGLLYGVLLPLVVSAQNTNPLPQGPIIGAATPTPAPTLTPAPLVGALGPYEYPPAVNPLTGLTLADPSVLDRRPIIVKVSNSPALVRPQAGIQAADLVYEHYTEVGVTRFSAIFWANAPERVGSIRSARLIDYELTPMYQGILAFAGGSIGVEKRIFGSERVIAGLCAQRDDKEVCRAEADVIGPAGFVPPSEFAERAYKGVLYGPPYYFRDTQVAAPHNLFVNLKALWELAAAEGFGQRPALRGMAFHPAVPPNAAGSGLLLEVLYRTELVEWYYDEATGRYYRSSDRQLHLDANTKEQVSAANVIVVYAGHYLTDIVESGWGDAVNWSAQITLWPAGDALFFRDGKRYAGRWLRPSRGELLSFQTADGQIFYLKPGNTWLQVVPLPEQMDPAIEWVRWQ
jgi:hypothetical protein